MSKCENINMLTVMNKKIYNQPATQIAHVVLNTIILAGSSSTPGDSIVPGGGGDPVDAI